MHHLRIGVRVMKRPALDKYINAQVKYWQQRMHTLTAPPEKKSLRQFITISREYGCSGYGIAKEVIKIMNSADRKPEPLWAAYERQVLDRCLGELEVS